jgi:hypothetical protein
MSFILQPSWDRIDNKTGSTAFSLVGIGWRLQLPSLLKRNSEMSLNSMSVRANEITFATKYKKVQ